MAIFTTFRKQKDDKSTLFLEVNQSNFGMTCKAKRKSTPTHNCIKNTVFRNCVIYFVDFLSGGVEF